MDVVLWVAGILGLGSIPILPMLLGRLRDHPWAAIRVPSKCAAALLIWLVFILTLAAPAGVTAANLWPGSQFLVLSVVVVMSVTGLVMTGAVVGTAFGDPPPKRDARTRPNVGAR